MKLKNLMIAGLAALAAAGVTQADVTLVVVGGNATRAIQYDRAAALLSGESVVTTSDSNVRSFVNGTIPGKPGLGNVTSITSWRVRPWGCRSSRMAPRSRRRRAPR